MPHWVRHTQSSTTVGSFWNARTNEVIVDNCTMSEQANFQTQFTALSANAGLNAFPPLKSAMLAMWPGMRIDCCFDSTRPPRTDTIPGRIFICGMNNTQIQAEICKGLVEESMATSPEPQPQPLEQMAMVFSCFGAPLGVPTPAQFAAMVALPQVPGAANERYGQFLIWNRTTGEVFNKITTTSGGFWSSSTTISKGTRGFISPSWIA